MKNRLRLIVVLLGLFISTTMVSQKATAQVSVSFQVFYDDLSPYGTWIDYPGYGYVWDPGISRGFVPYATNGYWIYTDYGWTWVSNYRWGWAPFHYGRWFYDSYYGWLWLPDNDWGPAWVTWRSSNDYCGWAPIGPGISIDIAFSNRYSLPYNQWTFVPNRYFGGNNISNYYINSTKNTTIINNTTVINNVQVDNSRNIRYNPGPNRTEMERRAGKKFNPVAIRETNKPGQYIAKNQLQIYRPRVQKNDVNGRKPAPSKVISSKDVKTRVQTPGNNSQQQRGREEQQQRGLEQQKVREQQQQRIKEQQQQRGVEQQKQREQQQQRVKEEQQRKGLEQQKQREQQQERVKEEQQRKGLEQQKQREQQQQRVKEEQQQKGLEQQKQREQQQQRMKEEQQRKGLEQQKVREQQQQRVKEQQQQKVREQQRVPPPQQQQRVTPPQQQPQQKGKPPKKGNG